MEIEYRVHVAPCRWQPNLFKTITRVARDICEITNAVTRMVAVTRAAKRRALPHRDCCWATDLRRVFSKSANSSNPSLPPSSLSDNCKDLLRWTNNHTNWTWQWQRPGGVAKVGSSGRGERLPGRRSTKLLCSDFPTYSKLAAPNTKGKAKEKQ